MKEILESNEIIITQTAKLATCSVECMKLISLIIMHLLMFNTTSQTNNNSIAANTRNHNTSDTTAKTHQEQHTRVK